MNTIRRLLIALEDWCMDESGFLSLIKFLIIIGVVALLVVVPISFLVDRYGGPSSEQRCLEAGGGWAIVGHHTAMVYNAATKTTMPKRVTDYGCLRVERP